MTGIFEGDFEKKKRARGIEIYVDLQLFISRRACSATERQVVQLLKCKAVGSTPKRLCLGAYVFFFIFQDGASVNCTYGTDITTAFYKEADGRSILFRYLKKHLFS